jgi:hypothetical protein
VIDVIQTCPKLHQTFLQSHSSTAPKNHPTSQAQLYQLAHLLTPSPPPENHLQSCSAHPSPILPVSPQLVVHLLPQPAPWPQGIQAPFALLGRKEGKRCFYQGILKWMKANDSLFVAEIVTRLLSERRLMRICGSRRRNG